MMNEISNKHNASFMPYIPPRPIPTVNCYNENYRSIIFIDNIFYDILLAGGKIRNLVQARGNLARTKRDYLVACVNLEKAEGTPGEKGGT